MDPARQGFLGTCGSGSKSPYPQRYPPVAPPQARPLFRTSQQHEAPPQAGQRSPPHQPYPTPPIPMEQQRLSSFSQGGALKGVPMPSLGHIPRKKSQSHAAQIEQQQCEVGLESSTFPSASRISIVSESPFIIKVKLAGVPLDRRSFGSISVGASAGVESVPRKRPKAVALAVTDKSVENGADDINEDNDRDDDADINDDSRSKSSSDRLRSSSRSKKRARKSYAEDLEDTDSDVSNENETDAIQRPPPNPSQQTTSTPSSTLLSSMPMKRKRIKRSVPRQLEDAAKVEEVKELLGDDDDDDYNSGGGEYRRPSRQDYVGAGGEGNDVATKDPNNVEAPPPGVLASLWYSRECVLHVFVIEKILGWKTRPMVRLRYNDSVAAAATQRLTKSKQHGAAAGLPDSAKAAKISAIVISESITDGRKRIEISRINPAHCPVVMKVASTKEERRARNAGEEPDFVAHTSDTEREEVFLIKWRGRSHLHCSWERRRDLEKFDATNTAKGKIKRYIQNQEMALGKDWKLRLDEGRSVLHHQIHAHGSQLQIEAEEDKNAPTEEEDFFPPDYTEVERILACDESEMDMNIFARQRALNLKAEAEALRRTEENGDAVAAAALAGTGPSENGSADGVLGTKIVSCSLQSAVVPQSNEDKSLPADDDTRWDPEDYVRYVVKWKGLQFADVTWEYWKDIKHDFVDQAEDFWYRQRAPSPEDVKAIMNRPHPQVRDFKKLSESPLFGMSSAKRPVVDIDHVSKSLSDGDDDMEAPALRLRGYQLEGVNWLLWNWWNRRSCILADEMGLGKTIQSVCFLDQLYRHDKTQIRGPFLIVAPLSLVNQWQSESTTWAPDLNVILYHGSADARDFLVKQEFFYSDQFIAKATVAKLKRQHITKFHILITTYEVVLKDVAVLSKIKWKALIVDEAHRLKNAKSRLFEELASVPREFCLLLTGTPLQNSTEELWALLHFADPANFDTKDAFVEKFGQLTDAQQVSDLHSLLRPYLLRRVKEDVEKSLPPKEETILEVTLTPIQKAFYKAIYERNTAFLFKGAKPSNAPSLMNVMMELRKCCNHPFLIRGAEERILADAASVSRKLQNKPVIPEVDDEDTSVDWQGLTAEHLVNSSGKMVLLSKLLPKLQSGGHKVLIFSQMVRVLDLLEDLLRIKRYKFERLDGSKSASSRSAAVDRFNRKSCHRFVMLLSTRAGGLGLNLTSADTVIIFDSDWNPQNDLQAMARAHRIGQTRAVRVYRLLTAKTYEMHMFHSASMKLGLDRAVLAHQRQSTDDDDSSSTKKHKSKSEKEMQAKEIDELLKKGAYDVFRDEDDKEAQQFMETDIDQLLERSSRKVTYGNSSNPSISSGLGSFSKASFVASSSDGDGKDVDLDDPDFWEKAVGLEAPTDSIGDDEATLMYDKRSRKQVQVYDPYAEYAEAEKKKKHKIAQKIKLEKEEKERIRLEKKQKREEERERKKREKDELLKSKESKKKEAAASKAEKDREIRRVVEKKEKPPKKKLKKAERKRAARRAEREDPVLERIKQAWEVPQRNRATSSALRFGFGRLCKIRHEANLTSLPIQDIEIFVRAYCYQLGLQAAVCLMKQLCNRSGETSNDHAGDMASFLMRALGGVYRVSECVFIARAIESALKLQQEVLSRRRVLRIPLVLAESSFTSELRSGGALRALRRLAFLSRLNAVIEECVDGILADLGHEELGKRGCSIKDLSTLDVDLKARHVSTEELSHALGMRLGGRLSQGKPVLFSLAPWWNRSCDLALIVGTFIHGLGNYEAMRNDEELPFGRRIAEFTIKDPGSAQSFLNFAIAAKAARKVYDDALSMAKSKAQVEAHEAVAAVLAASKLTNRNTLASNNERRLQENSTSSVTQEQTIHDGAEKCSAIDDSAVESSQCKGKSAPDDSDKITLHRLSCAIESAIQISLAATATNSSKVKPLPTTVLDHINDDVPFRHCLPMPNAKFLDHLLLNLVDTMTGECRKGIRPNALKSVRSSDNGIAPYVEAIDATVTIAKKAYAICGNWPSIAESSFRGSKCGSYHRSLADGSNYDSSAASGDLAAITTGADASRYQRGKWVPLLLTRYGLGALAYADKAVLDSVIQTESVAENEETKQTLMAAGDVFGISPRIAPTSDTKATEVNANGGVPAKKMTGILSYVPRMILSDTKMRASISAVVLCYGLPFCPKHKPWQKVQDGVLTKNDCLFFSMTIIIDYISKMSGTSAFLQESEVRTYIDRVLIPHCFCLCLFESGKSKEKSKASARGNESSFLWETAKPGRSGLKTPLPDPCIPMKYHSEESIASAFAILRRIRLSRAVQFIVGGGISRNILISFLQSPHMRGGMDGLPVWWCPWVHDVAILAHAAVHGLFAIVQDREDQSKMRKLGSVFERNTLERYIRNVFVDGMDDRSPALPKSFVKKSSIAALEAWVKAQALIFPTAYTLERRMAMICSELTKGSDNRNHNCAEPSWIYRSIPMFDHGGWPIHQ